MKRRRELEREEPWKNFQDKFPEIEKEDFEMMFEKYRENSPNIIDKFIISQELVEDFQLSCLEGREQEAISRIIENSLKISNEKLTLRPFAGGFQRRNPKTNQWE